MLRSAIKRQFGDSRPQSQPDHRLARWLLLLALLLAVIAALPLLANAGLLNTRGGGDSPFLLQRVQQYETALRDGHFPVRWMPDAYYGYGYPFFNYYAPLSIMVAVLFKLLGFTYVGSIELAQLAAFLVAAGATFALARRWFGNPWAGLLSSVAYTFAPFHMVNIYVRGDSLAEFWAMAIFPLLLLAIERLVDAIHREQIETAVLKLLWRARQSTAILAILLAALILSHNISAMLFAPFAALYGLARVILIFRRNSKAALTLLLSLAAAAILGLVLSAWFWWPALQESSLAQLGPVTSGYFHYSNHFRSQDLIQSTFLFNYDVADGEAFRMGLAQSLLLIATLLSLLSLFFRFKPNAAQEPFWPRITFAVASLLAATWLITPLSTAIWDSLALLQFTQFPWRLLSIQALFISLLAGMLSLLPGRSWIVSVAVALLVIAGLGNLRSDHILVDDSAVEGRDLAIYEWFTGNVGSTVSAEYLPVTVNPRQFTSNWIENQTDPESGRYDLAVIDRGSIDQKLTDSSTQRLSWDVVSSAAETGVIAPILHWPGWKGTIDGQPLALSPAAGSGLIFFTIPSGAHSVEIQLGRTPERMLAELLSLLAGALLLLTVGVRQLWRVARRHWYLLPATLLVAVVASFWPTPDSGDNQMNWDFEQQAYLHQGEILFEGDLRLDSYRYSSDTIAAGDSLKIYLDWSEPSTDEIELALTTPAVTRYSGAPILAQATGNNGYLQSIAIPADAPSGAYLPRLRLIDRPAVTASGQQRGDLFLRPIWIFGGKEGDPSLRPMDAIITSAVQSGPDTAAIHLSWFTESRLSHNYNVSLRLADNLGTVAWSEDLQPGHGFRPSSLWSPGHWIADQYSLTVPSSASATAPYSLLLQLYDVGGGNPVLMRNLGYFENSSGKVSYSVRTTSFELPEGARSVSVSFGNDIQLVAYDLKRDGDEVEITLFWKADKILDRNFTHFVHLVDTATGEAISQHDDMPQYGTYPTSQWEPGEIVADRVTLSIAAVFESDARLYVGLYENLGDSFPRLPTTVNGSRLPDDRFPIELDTGQTVK